MIEVRFVADGDGARPRKVSSALIDAAASLGRGVEFTPASLAAHMNKLGRPVPLRGATQLRASMQPYIEMGLIETFERGVFRLAEGVFTGEAIPSRAMREEAAAKARAALPGVVAVPEPLLRALFRVFLSTPPGSAEHDEAAEALGRAPADLMERLNGWQAATPEVPA